MKTYTYTVILRNRKDERYVACDYSEDGDKYVFHTEKDPSGKPPDPVVLKADVMGIHREEDWVPSVFSR
jgi:hypothetical protein